jgi:polysaccharide deacetylase family protein (PEP-CTERM system associated)
VSYHLLLTIDVEDWFQVENFKECIPYSSWSSYELRVEKNTHRLLDLLDSSTLKQSEDFRCRRIDSSQFHPRQPRPEKRDEQEETEETKQSQQSRESCLTKTNSPKATFFILGWIAERLPHLVREIHSRGHEVASHGYSHNLCTDCSPKDLRTDLVDSKKILEDIIGDRVYGYRAPSFSINHDILKVIEDCGYLYDSSLNSFGSHGRYGHLDLSQNGRRGIALQISKNQNSKLKIPPGRRPLRDAGQNLKSKIFYELPISNIRLGSQILPWGGGAYFRLIPFPLFKIGVEFILKQENAYLFYFHPWEIDPNQPRVNDLSVFYKIRHYVNLSTAYSKLSRFIRSFQQHHFITCDQYINNIGTSP